MEGLLFVAGGDHICCSVSKSELIKAKQGVDRERTGCNEMLEWQVPVIRALVVAVTMRGIDYAILLVEHDVLAHQPPADPEDCVIRRRLKKETI